MRQFFRRRPKAAATGSAVEHDPPEQSVAGASSSTKTFPSGIKLFHSPEHAIVE
jgi:hypothetical protein